MPRDAIYVVNQGYQLPTDYEVKLESTIGIYGTGLIDAIPEEDILAQYRQEDKDALLPNGLNPAFYAGGNWASMYANSLQGDGTEYVRRFTYALARGPLQDAAGANAIWNITNVTRSDRRYHYLDAAGTYVKYSAADPDVQAGFESYISRVDPGKKHPSYWEGTIEQRITAYLTDKNLDAEMSDDEYTDLMVWHRGLAVPAVFLLAAGIVSGAVWAYQSWGRYWGWDPKETCALVMMLIYSVPLHSGCRCCRAFRKPKVLHLYLLIAVFSVLFTYFGANYLLAGLHSYA